MRRRLFTIAPALSLILCMATVGLWVRSYWVSDGLILARHGNLSFARCFRGHVGIIRIYGIAKTDGFTPVQWKSPNEYELQYFIAPEAISGGYSMGHVNFHLVGIALVGGDQEYLVSKNPFTFHTYVSRLIVIPFWLPFLLTAWPLGPMIIRLAWRISFRYPAGTCRRCGYDLRASKDRCPECGTAIKTGQLLDIDSI
jgi:hypothetical protein